MEYTSSSLYYSSADESAFQYGERDAFARHDREGSVSGSETSSSYAHHLYHGAKDDPDASDDPHMALTSQTLNADGTPKRPMNAFMIFARKRRPEISAANQMMRTGDVSKILSREWNTMSMSDKKFYLDQAKKLKDNFNCKYPDYVYRRRPNNSRRKRKTDQDCTSPEQSPTVDREEGVFEDSSLFDSEESKVDPTSHVQSSNGLQAQGIGASFAGADDFLQSHQALGHIGTSRTNHPRMSSDPTSLTMANSHRLPPLVDTDTRVNHSQSLQHAYPTGYSSQMANVAQDPWGYSRERARPDQGRSSWPLLPTLDTSMIHQRSGISTALPSARGDTFSSPEDRSSWSNTTSPTPSSGSASSSAVNIATAFPTLTSPFVPPQSPSQRSVDTGSPMSAAGAGRDYSLSVPRAYMGRTDAQDQRRFPQSNVLPLPTSNAYAAGADALSQWQSQYRAQPLSPPILPVSAVPLHSAAPTGVSSPHSVSNNPYAGYWDSARYAR